MGGFSLDGFAPYWTKIIRGSNSVRLFHRGVSLASLDVSNNWLQQLSSVNRPKAKCLWHDNIVQRTSYALQTHTELWFSFFNQENL